MKKSVPIAEILAIELSVRTYPTSDLRFLRHDPQHRWKLFGADFFSYDIPNTSSYVHNTFVYFCRFSIFLRVHIFLKSVWT